MAKNAERQVMHTVFHILSFLFVGIVLGAGYFALLHAEVGQFMRGMPARYAIMMHVLRLAVAALMFWLIAQYGAMALLAALAGFTLVLATLKPLTA
jgi:FtsH-binding integral membrane protein